MRIIKGDLNDIPNDVSSSVRLFIAATGSGKNKRNYIYIYYL